MRRGGLLLTSFFPKPWRESTVEITSACRQRCYIMGSGSSRLKKKKKSIISIFKFTVNKNTFKIQGLTALLEDKCLLNALNNLVLRFKATDLISTSVLHWREAPLGTKPKNGSPPHSCPQPFSTSEPGNHTAYGTSHGQKGLTAREQLTLLMFFYCFGVFLVLYGHKARLF